MGEKTTRQKQQQQQKCIQSTIYPIQFPNDSNSINKQTKKKKKKKTKKRFLYNYCRGQVTSLPPHSAYLYANNLTRHICFVSFTFSCFCFCSSFKVLFWAIFCLLVLWFVVASRWQFSFIFYVRWNHRLIYRIFSLFLSFFKLINYF